MARKQRNSVDYFPFICKEGKAMFYIENKYANDGFAVWIKLLRQLAVTNYHYINLSNKTDLMYLSAKCKVSEEVMLSIIEDLVSLGEFDARLWSENQVIWSDKFVDSIQDAYKKRSNICITYDGLLDLLVSLGIRKPTKRGSKEPVNPQTKEEYSKEEYSKEEKTKEESPSLDFKDLEPIEHQKEKTGISARKNAAVPTEQEVIDYFAEKGYTTEAAKKAFSYYNEPMIDSGGRVWRDRDDRTVKSWKRKMISTWFKPENEIGNNKGLTKDQQERIEKACKWAVSNLNKALGTNYTAGAEPTVEAIKKLIVKGYGVIEFKKVFEKKVDEWRGTDFEKNLQPHILFGKNFEAYLEQPEMSGSSGNQVQGPIKMHTEPYSR